MISMLICAVWMSTIGKNYFKNLPVGLPVNKIQNDLMKGLPKEGLNRMPEATASDLKELGLEKDAVSYDIVSPMMTMKEKMAKTGQTVSTLPSQWQNFKNSIKTYFITFNENASGIFGVLFSLLGLLWLTRSSAMLQYISNTLFNLSRFALFLISLSSFAIAFYANRNIWNYAVFFWFPAGVLCLSAFGLWLNDRNFPIWKRLYGSFILPLISSLSLGFFF
jgi:hypothetical protein